MALAWSPDGRQLAGAGLDRTGRITRVWELASGNEALALRGHRGLVTALVFTRDGGHLVSAAVGDDGKAPLSRCWGEVWAWDAATGEGKLVPKTDEKSQGVSCVGLGPDGTRLVTGHRDGTVRVWAVEMLNEKRVDR
jgi:WD40 repeat protein